MIAYTYALLAALFWGAGFIGSRFGLEALGPMWITFIRFFIAFLATVPILFFIKRPKWNKERIIGLLVCSVCLAGMMFLQVKALQYTTVAKSGFIIILYAFITPVLTWLFLGKKLGGYYWVLALCAFGGVSLLLEFNLENFNKGDALALGCAFFTALHILSVNKYARSFQNVVAFNVFQMLVVCLITLPLAVFMEGAWAPASFVLNMASHPEAFWGLLFMGVFSTAMGFFLQLRSQLSIEPHIASLVFLLESPFGAFLGWLVLNERMDGQALIGCGITLAAVSLMPMEKTFQEALENVVFSYERKFKRKTFRGN